ncbi:hypothetical protein [Curtobacterium aurantiacum]|uniref:hypothetical protein n=1 Tax=Curtobacterium aurantiacum TaxID=3236919 RepID=UPI001BE0343B|nr:hypothetical protein [Curtobacterium flaccumfaciens]MBT1677710.1 hypothetical protein [Curtobacterium flaccumfaciens pv. flaccumfaciens]
MADSATNPECLVRADGRDVQPSVALEPTGERDTEDRRRRDVTEHLVGTEPRGECPGALVHGLGWERRTDAVERANEVARLEPGA